MCDCGHSYQKDLRIPAPLRKCIVADLRLETFTDKTASRIMAYQGWNEQRERERGMAQGGQGTLQGDPEGLGPGLG